MAPCRRAYDDGNGYGALGQLVMAGAGDGEIAEPVKRPRGRPRKNPPKVPKGTGKGNRNPKPVTQDRRYHAKADTPPGGGPAPGVPRGAYPKGGYPQSKVTTYRKVLAHFMDLPVHRLPAYSGNRLIPPRADELTVQEAIALEMLAIALSPQADNGHKISAIKFLMEKWDGKNEDGAAGKGQWRTPDVELLNCYGIQINVNVTEGSDLAKAVTGAMQVIEGQVDGRPLLHD